MCKLKKLSNVKPESDDKEDSALNAEEQAAAATVDGGFGDDRQVQPHVYAAVVAMLPPGWHAQSLRASQALMLLCHALQRRRRLLQSRGGKQRQQSQMSQTQVNRLRSVASLHSWI